jgi:hypothetical protein
MYRARVWKGGGEFCIAPVHPPYVYGCGRLPRFPAQLPPIRGLWLFEFDSLAIILNCVRGCSSACRPNQRPMLLQSDSVERTSFFLCQNPNDVV